ncbi:MAG: phosphoenolpyruvate carboxykinase [Actinomycetota bacterium]|nr:phosphoenolpyruvate carboxykinase [Actinomycetota bacterium]MDD5666571.1 phosphoenolpyruvate carboxykinase [Actinomycetota bacterium]
MELRPVILSAHDLCRTPAELLGSALFADILGSFVGDLAARGSELHGFLREQALVDGGGSGAADASRLVELLTLLSARSIEDVSGAHPAYAGLAAWSACMHELVESLYNYWRKLERYILIEEGYQAAKVMSVDYHNWFIDTAQSFEALVRETYRRIAFNVGGELPRVYRQLPSGAGAGALIEHIPWRCPEGYEMLADIPFMQLVVIEPPLILYPRRNYRRGAIKPLEENPLRLLGELQGSWYCYPARVGLLRIFIFFSSSFLHLGISLCNLFEMIPGEEIHRGDPDGILVFGGTAGSLSPDETYYHEDAVNDLVAAYVSGIEEHDYFGYMKKAALTLHNVIMLNRGMLPLHGAMARIRMSSGKTANIVIVGDSGAGKSESLEALRAIAGEGSIDIKVVFDDMGVLGSDKGGRVLAYGTEIGAFVRLDDLQPGYAYSEVDRSIFMNPQLSNARVVIPVSEYGYIIRGHAIDALLYANNYEEIDEDNPILEFFSSIEEALPVFESGARMAKGTTDEKGLVHSYFANPFGAAQKRREHDAVARYFFERLLAGGVRIGTLRTRLGIGGYEMRGPEEAARAILREFF